MSRVFQDAESYNQLLADAKLSFMELFEMEGWKHESGKDLQEGMIYSQNVKKYGRKIFKLKVLMCSMQFANLATGLVPETCRFSVEPSGTLQNSGPQLKFGGQCLLLQCLS